MRLIYFLWLNDNWPILPIQLKAKLGFLFIRKYWSFLDIVAWLLFLFFLYFHLHKSISMLFRATHLRIYFLQVLTLFDRPFTQQLSSNIILTMSIVVIENMSLNSATMLCTALAVLLFIFTALSLITFIIFAFFFWKL